MSESGILVEVDDGVARITINRPERRNALDAGSRDALLAALDSARADAGVRAVLLTGAGDAFCSGADLSGGGGRSDAATTTAPAPPSPSPSPPGIDSRAVTETLRSGSQRLIRTLWEFDKPTVAAVAGPAAGMGAHLALACDLVVMAEGARLIEVFARRGLVVDAMGAFLLTVGHWALVQAAKFDPQLSQVYVRHIRYQDYYPARAPISASPPRIRVSVPTPKEMRA